MIGSVDVRCSAHNPQLPLSPIFTFVGSPSNLRILDIPKGVGQFKVDSVKVVVKYPDNSIQVVEAVRNGSVYVATIPACEISGKTRGGVEILCDCTDENGNPADGFVVGKGDILVLERDSKALRDIEKFYVRFSDELPINPAKGDMMAFGGSVRIFDGEEWIDCGKSIERLSQLENDVGFITENDLPEIPTKVSELENDNGYITSEDLPTKVSELENDAGYLSENEVKKVYSNDEQSRITGDGKIQTIEDVIVWTFDFSFTYDPEDPFAESRNFRAVRTGGARGQLHIYDEDDNELANVSSHDGNYTYNFTYSFDDVSYNGQCVQTKNQSIEEKWANTDSLLKKSEIPSTKLSQFQNDLFIPRPALDYVTPEQLKVTTDKIPEQASSENQLADKDFVNSSIMTNTAYFKGTFNSVDELPTDRVTPNDYAFVIGQDSEGNTTYNRYKFTADGEWLFEYTLNNSSFTSNQWATINSGLTATSLDDYAKKDEIDNTKILATSDIDIDNPKEGDIYISGDGRKFSYERDLDGPWGAIWDDRDEKASQHRIEVNIVEAPDWFDAYIMVIDEDDQYEAYVENVGQNPTEITFTYYNGYVAKAVKGLGVYKWEVVSLATSDEVPTKMSDLQNDKGFLTNKDIEPTTNPLYEGQGVAFKSEFAVWAEHSNYVNWEGINYKPTVLETPENIATKSDIQNQPFATLSGEYEDGTTFSFDVVTK